MGRLLERAIDFARRRPRHNPPADGEVDERVQEFCIEQKMRGDNLGDFDEGEWREALDALGVQDIDMASYVEDVASWGTDG